MAPRARGAGSRLLMAGAARRPVMLQEIHATPARVEVLLTRESKPLQKALAGLRQSPPGLILIAGRGTSDHAAIYGRYLFEHHLGIPVSGAALSLFTLYPAPLHLGGALAIGVSQSGESADVVKALQVARERGAYTLAVTNTAASSLTKLAHHTLLLRAGKERAVAATKTYTAELVAMTMICRALGGGLAEEDLARLPEHVQTALECEAAVAEVAPRYRYAPRCLVLARGFNYGTARETALKLMETCYLGASGMSAADFLHGPIAFVDAGTPVVCFAADGATYGFMVDVARRLREQRVDVLSFTNRRDIAEVSAMAVYCPVPVSEGLTPVPFAILGQLLACYLAIERGLDPDSPRRLQKVTLTW